ncbi:pimeloyl-ACP methyl ester carboxylesterase [Actinoplanes campanulatus]|uniref:Pimeloyl-ACP methyl ester carboxylesterase n=1 Tax=Actinoplanes campanulatus TaxID=113559 RepID=A0A7W5AEN8_9ACTN|nr:alpha/beta fold hydrolase [Actinoplanes campanulatus]MBB3094394.1 pimeloyl-ACP methyl ester carboxylesterase [Actinoplanes campanulatus]GGN20734.1 hydrolase [Actinoplanes campanulatus]GID35691.1 hydrolase [Actinoplanes campanulatus]
MRLFSIGEGPPLVLLHGLGSTRAAWTPVLDRLAATHTVHTVDLPGCGDTPPLPPGVAPAPRRLAEAVALMLDRHGVDTPHVAGHSLGGWVALELAALRPVASITLLSPAGLWRRRTPAYCTVSLLLTWAGCRYARRPLTALVGSAWGRRLLLWQFHASPGRISPEVARRGIADLGRGPGFRATLRATRRIRYRPTEPLTMPVTLAFGMRDRLLLAGQSRHTGQLPAHTHRADLPGAGHVPMDDTPSLVVAAILDTTVARR